MSVRFGCTTFKIKHSDDVRGVANCGMLVLPSYYNVIQL